jgi:tetratricopeptide (TPR) repeat protein
MCILTNDDMGPLPQSDRNHELQTLSVNALKAALPVERFITRDERIEDYGVDLSLELRINRRPANLRAQVQMKGTDEVDLNLDGSASLSVRTSNLNYLLNGVSPLYILYIAPRNELRFTWGREEQRRLVQDNPQWMQQTWVTLRFHNLLTAQALEDIYERIRREARLQRSIHDRLAEASLTEDIIIGIDPQTLAASDPEQINAALLTAGITLVSSGFSAEVLEAVHHLNFQAARAPRIQIICAYAHYTQGRYDLAIGHLREATLRHNQLTPDDQEFTTFLRGACDYQSGRITLTEYSERHRAWSEAGSETYALAHRLDSLRYELLAELNPIRRDELTAQVQIVAADILARSDISSAYR